MMPWTTFLPHMKSNRMQKLAVELGAGYLTMKNGTAANHAFKGFKLLWNAIAEVAHHCGFFNLSRQHLMKTS